MATKQITIERFIVISAKTFAEVASAIAPLTMRKMARHVHDAGSYAPVTVLIDERADGVHLSYDRMASLIAPYGHSEALVVARALDSKVEILLLSAAQ